MKQLLMITVIPLFLLGCNMNPSKEARIQELETEIQLSMETIEELENRIQTLEESNEQFKARIIELENP